MESEPLLSFEVKGNVLVISILRSIELFLVEDLRKEIRKVLNSENRDFVIFKMNEVPYLDSSGIGIFVQLQYQYKGRIAFRFCDMNPNVRLIFEYTNLISQFSIDQNLEKSLQAVDSENDTRNQE